MPVRAMPEALDLDHQREKYPRAGSNKTGSLLSRAFDQGRHVSHRKTGLLTGPDSFAIMGELLLCWMRLTFSL